MPNSIGLANDCGPLLKRALDKTKNPLSHRFVRAGRK